MIYKVVLRNKLYFVCYDESGFEIDRILASEVETIHPNLTPLMLSEIITTMETMTKAEKLRYKQTVCDALEISIDTLGKALRRIYKKMYSKKINYKDPETQGEYDLSQWEGSLDRTHWTADLKEMADNLKNVPKKYRRLKYDMSLCLIGKKYGCDEQKIEYFRQMAKMANMEKENEIPYR